MTPILRATVITDASYCPNTRSGAYGAWITMDSDGLTPLRIRKSGRLQGLPDHAAHAELLAALTGVWYAVQAGARIILLQTDNQQVVEILNGRGKIASNKLIRIYGMIKNEHFGDVKISARHVKGHTTKQDARSFVNRWCDEQAGIHMRALRMERDPGYARKIEKNAIKHPLKWCRRSKESAA